MALAGLPEHLAIQLREARPRKLVEKELELKRKQQEETERFFNGEAENVRPLLVAERVIAVRMDDCDLLLRAVKASANALSKSGKELHRISHVVRANPGFKRSLQSGDPPLAQAGLAALEAFTNLGTVLMNMSEALTDDASKSLHEVRKTIRAKTAEFLGEIAVLEQQEESSSEHLKEVKHKKEKLDSDISSQMADHDTYEQGGVSTWFWKPSNSRLQKAMQDQRDLVEKLANQSETTAAARQRTKDCTDKFKRTLKQIDGECKNAIQQMLKQTATHWDSCSEKMVASVMGRLRSATTAADASAAAAAPVPAGLVGAALLSAKEQQTQQPQEVTEELNDVQVCFPDSGDDEVEHPGAGRPPVRKLPVPECVAATNNVSDSVARTMNKAEVSSNAGTTDKKKSEPTQHPKTDKKEPKKVVQFGEDVKKLGFEVLWETEWPSVLKVLAGGSAEAAGVAAGDVIYAINGTCTQGRSRDEMMPLLKIRPLELQLKQS
mmetsp:Transcript_45539/g.97642  ORF Transcript_45539/g.97642 Transcript_45539/m.97642 type:complete len:493 (+) Transcript_45539:63-1541(+)|eukprot:CAMPEP_0206555474 /NCGR_PEP_ID=MMETSP0325_2-20121206/17818_1 /ASSEMBLY_ACC=CAM_ASM_000347 /TAXON_ID=2866 /ORGANISM="Crypthecodinium cohnii, Strain Seligo" /LENGTH=492 /DNA_ID=CAMNT_0054055787 /DNA_START=5 /DNA_END=1483 /DNA_ORIENTATION=+